MNGALTTPGYLPALLRELSHVLWGLTENAEAKQVQQTNQNRCFVPDQKNGPKIDHYVSNLTFH